MPDSSKEPQSFTGFNPLAVRLLTELAVHPESTEIVLGGYFALQQHVNYRVTHDVDAWWHTRATLAAEAMIHGVMGRIATEEGATLRERRFGDTISFELCRGQRKYFSFQISVRSVSLEPPKPSPWPPILIETLRDNVGAKMSALVDRGSPRDFSDIRQVVSAGLLGVEECWSLWGRKNSDQSVDSAKQKVLLHLAALEQRRPLQSITDAQQRDVAAQMREWFRRTFLDVA